MRRCHMIGVARQAIADHFGVDLGAALPGALIFLEHHDARALAHDEAVAAFVPRAAGAPGLVAETGRERPRLAEAGNADRADRAFRAAASMTSASSSAIIRAASPIEWAPVEQAVTTA